MIETSKKKGKMIYVCVCMCSCINMCTLACVCVYYAQKSEKLLYKFQVVKIKIEARHGNKMKSEEICKVLVIMITIYYEGNV